MDSKYVNFGRKILQFYPPLDKEQKNIFQKLQNKKEQKITNLCYEGDKQVQNDVKKNKFSVDYSKFDKMSKQIDQIQEDYKEEKKREERAKNPQWSTPFHDHGKDIQIYEKSNQEKIAAIQKFKGIGNKALTAKVEQSKFESKQEYRKEVMQNLSKASYYYAQALLYLVYLIPENDQQTKIAKELEVKCRLNQCLAFQKQDRLKQSIQQANSALRIQPKNIKALYRKAKSQYLDCKIVQALETIKIASDVEPGDQDVVQLQKEIKVAEIKSRIGEKEYTKNFQKVMKKENQADYQPNVGLQREGQMREEEQKFCDGKQKNQRNEDEVEEKKDNQQDDSKIISEQNQDKIVQTKNKLWITATGACIALIILMIGYFLY